MNSLDIYEQIGQTRIRHANTTHGATLPALLGTRIRHANTTHGATLPARLRTRIRHANTTHGATLPARLRTHSKFEAQAAPAHGIAWHAAARSGGMTQQAGDS